MSQAKCLLALGFDVRIVTGEVDFGRWESELAGIRVESVGSRDWLDRLGGRETWISRRLRRLSKVLSDVDVAIAHNYPMPRVLAHAETKARKIWYCNEPYREIHLETAHPTLAQRRQSGTIGNTMAEQHYMRMYRKQFESRFGIRHRYTAEGQRDLATAERFGLMCGNSGFARELAMQTYGQRPCKVLYPIVRFPAPRAPRRGLDRSALRILVHTRLVAEKNIDTVIRGFALFVSSGRNRGQLHIVGEGPCRQALEHLAEELRIGHMTRFHGFLSEAELDRLYDTCEVFTLLSIDEPFGMVFPEAAARGLIMVGPSHGGPLEILGQGEFGFVTDAFSPESLADVYNQIASVTDQEVDRSRTAADQSCRQRFAESAIASQIVSTYELDG